MDKEKLAGVLADHKRWLSDNTKGKRADLEGADLEGADLKGADLRGADLEGADLEGAALQVADLKGADLRGADLRGADLRGADLRGADLRGADLRGADLDFASWPLHCGAIGVKAGERLVAQLLFHVARLDVSEASDWAKEAHAAALPYADKFCEYRDDVSPIGVKEASDADSK